MVSGFLSPSVDKAAFPDDVANYLKSIDYAIDVNAKLGHDEDKTDFMEDAHRTLDARFEAFSHYLSEDDWDLFFGVFMTTDRVNHFLFKDYERLAPDANGDMEGLKEENREFFLEFYRQVDEYLGKIRSMLPDDVTLVVASDHGFTSLDYEVNCNTWLEEQGWLSYTDDDHEELADIADETRAYSLIPGRFYINLEGREPRGSVPQAEYEAARDELKSELEAWEGPNGKKVADRVVEKEEAFRGDHDEIAPDLVVVPNHGFDLKSGFKDKESVFSQGPRNGMHSFDNASLIVDDPDVVIEDADLFDIAPTILDLMELDYTRTEFDGGSLVRQ
jgi:predicted AlkP superfamily phosphohydrolase/phosphomutase